MPRVKFNIVHHSFRKKLPNIRTPLPPLSSTLLRSLLIVTPVPEKSSFEAKDALNSIGTFVDSAEHPIITVAGDYKKSYKMCWENANSKLEKKLAFLYGTLTYLTCLQEKSLYPFYCSLLSTTLFRFSLVLKIC